MPVESNLAESHSSGFDVAVRVARLGMESSGEGVETMERYVARVARAYGVAVDTVVLPESVLITDVSSGDTDRVSVIRATPGMFRLDQLVGLKQVLGEVELGLPSEAACSRLDAIHAAPRLWPWWSRVAGVALFAAGFVPSVVASWGEVAAAAILGMLMGVLLMACEGRSVEPLLPFLAAFVLTVIGVTVRSGLSARTGITMLVLPALFITVPGDTLSAAAAELLGGPNHDGRDQARIGVLRAGVDRCRNRRCDAGHRSWRRALRDAAGAQTVVLGRAARVGSLRGRPCVGV